MRVAEVVNRGAPRRQQVGGDGDDGIEAKASSIHEVGSVAAALAELEQGDGVGALAEGHFQLRRLQADGFQIRFRIIVDELMDAEVLQFFEGVRDPDRGGARREGQDHAPGAIGRIAPQFEDFGAVGHSQMIENKIFQTNQRVLAPVVDGAGDEFQQLGVHNIEAFQADDLQKYLVARGGPNADQELNVIRPLLDENGRLRIHEAILLVGSWPAFELAAGNGGGGHQPLKGGKKTLDGGSLSGIAERLGHLPEAVGTLHANFRLTFGPDLDAGDGGQVEPGQEFDWADGRLAQVPFDKENKRKQHRGHEQPAPGVFWIHESLSSEVGGRRSEGPISDLRPPTSGLHLLRQSHTSPPNNNTAPGMPASKIHCAVCNCDLVITSLYSVIGLGPSSSSNCVRSSNQLTA